MMVIPGPESLSVFRDVFVDKVYGDLSAGEGDVVIVDVDANVGMFPYSLLLHEN